MTWSVAPRLGQGTSRPLAASTVPPSGAEPAPIGSGYMPSTTSRPRRATAASVAASWIDWKALTCSRRNTPIATRIATITAIGTSNVA